MSSEFLSSPKMTRIAGLSQIEEGCLQRRGEMNRQVERKAERREGKDRKVNSSFYVGRIGDLYLRKLRWITGGSLGHFPV